MNTISDLANVTNMTRHINLFVDTYSTFFSLVGYKRNKKKNESRVKAKVKLKY